jgi:DNA recombination protein RmuC
VNAASKEERQRALKEHVNSLKGHIKGLSLKDYQNLPGVTSLDYVLMFIPIESAFINAVEHEQEIIKLALDNQIMLVSPTNLLVALRTINNIWQYEYQNQNAKVIADKASKMYDKFANFVTDMEKIGKNMDTLRNSYDGAMNKLSVGRGNLIKQAEDFKALGVSTTKQLDTKYSKDESDDDDGEQEN